MNWSDMLVDREKLNSMLSILLVGLANLLLYGHFLDASLSVLGASLYVAY